MLSEKSKGKQRAVDHPLDIAGGPSAPSLPLGRITHQLVVRFTEGVPDLTVTVSQQDNVRDLKENIREARPELKDRRLRLIHAGRMLMDGMVLYSWLASLEEKQHRATPDEANASAESPKVATIWIHCSIGPKLDLGDDDSEEGKQATQLQPLRGFDRLTSVGFTEADIANFRRQFHSQSVSNYLDVEFETEEEYDEHARALEEQWIDSIDDAGTATLSQSSASSNSSVLQGILIGFFFPLMPFFFMRSQKVPVFWDNGSEHEPMPNVIFSRGTQMGLIVGCVVNLMFGMWRFLLDSS